VAKNKELAAAKRRQAAAAREAERRKANAKKKETVARAKRTKEGPKVQTSQGNQVKLTDEQFSDQDQVFWLCHGVNYLLSDHEQGTWTPLFPEIYEGTLPPPEAIAERVVTKFSEYPKDWPLEGKAALGWTIQSKEVVYVYYKEALRRLIARHPDGDAEGLCRQPHDPVVWGLFHFLKDRLMPSKAKKIAHERHQ
jgi:hypothetical protein